MTSLHCNHECVCPMYTVNPANVTNQPCGVGSICKHDTRNRPATIPDNPEADDTDLAHPAFWRGEDAATAQFICLLRDIKSGKATKVGKFSNPELTELRDWIIDLRDSKSAQAVMILDALESVKELRAYPLNSHEEECLNIIEEALKSGEQK